MNNGNCKQGALAKVSDESLVTLPSSWQGSCSGTESTLHQVEPNIGRVRSSMARALVVKFSSPKNIIFEPFVGSGVIAHESLIAGRGIVCCDSNPYAVVLARANFIYTEPERYKLEEPESSEIILTEGLDRVESIPGFEGSTQGSKDALIVILGFEGKRSLEVFQTVNPETTYAINGFPSFQAGWHRKSLEANMRFLNESRASDHLFFAPATDPFETKSVLSDIVKRVKSENEDMNIVVAPLGTKLQAFGVLLYALENRSAKVIYPFPSTYRPDYSYRYGPSWILQVNME